MPSQTSKTPSKLLNFQNKTNELMTHGYTVIDDFLPEDVARKISDLYKTENNWELIDQVRDNHYKHVFKIESDAFPADDEAYMAKFNRSTQLEKHDQINDIFYNYFKNPIQEISELSLNEHDNRCYKLESGDFYRVHIDDYAGKINSIFYVNENWVWDWGGVLHVGSHQNPYEVNAIFPKFNRLVLLHNEKFRSPHFISAVSHFAKEPRYTLVSFNK